MTATFRSSIHAAVYASLILGTSPLWAQNLTASPADSMGFTPARSPASEPIQQDSAQVKPGTPKLDNNTKAPGTSSAPQPVMMTPMPDDFNQSQPPMQNINDAMQSLMNSQSLGNSPSTTEAGMSYGGFCTTGRCQGSLHNSFANLGADDMLDGTNITTGNACTDKLLRTARRVAQSFGHPAGNCAFAVRKSLNMSGIYKGGGIGHAKDMGPGLTQMGYSNILKPGMTPDNAPEGAILVYGPAAVRGCRGKGSVYGHVEIKDFGGRYLYDGVARRNIQATMGAQCRPLRGVFVPGSGLKC